MGYSYGSNLGGQGDNKPEWELPNGNVDPDVANYYFRSETPTGRSIETPPPEVVQKFRNLIKAGAIVPKNQAAKDFAQSQGGWLAGDMTPLGPQIEGKPGGLSEGYWQIVINKAQAEAKTQLDAAIQRGYFGNVVPKLTADGNYDLQDPNLTADARAAILDFQQKVITTETTKRLADNTIRATDMQDAQVAAKLAEDKRQFDVTNAQTNATLYGGAVNPGAGQAGANGFTPTEAARQFNVGATGNIQNADGTWGTTLTSQQQSFEQQQAQAKEMANPRNYISAAMTGGARGGLGGQQALNLINPTTGQALPNVGAASTFQPMGQAAAGGPTGSLPYNPNALMGQQQMTPAMLALQQSDPAAFAARMANANAGNPLAPQPGDDMMMQDMRWRGDPNYTPPASPAARIAQLTAAQPGAGPGGDPGAGFTPLGTPGMSSPSDFASSGAPATGQPPTTPTGTGNQVPVTAFGAALMQNQAVPTMGALNTQGGYANAAQLQTAVNPSLWRPQDYARGMPTEKAGANALASFGGFSDEDTQAKLKANLPRFGAPKVGALA